MSIVYICSAAVNAPAARALAAELRAGGMQVSSTWHSVEGVEEARATEHELPPMSRREIADTCIRELRRADRCIVLGHPSMRGGLYEAGVADGLGIPVEWRGGTELTLFSTRGVQS